MTLHTGVKVSFSKFKLYCGWILEEELQNPVEKWNHFCINEFFCLLQNLYPFAKFRLRHWYISPVFIWCHIPTKPGQDLQNSQNPRIHHRRIWREDFSLEKLRNKIRTTGQIDTDRIIDSKLQWRTGWKTEICFGKYVTSGIQKWNYLTPESFSWWDLPLEYQQQMKTYKRYFGL